MKHKKKNMMNSNIMDLPQLKKDLLDINVLLEVNILEAIGRKDVPSKNYKLVRKILKIL